jgi:hypothetical protein
VQECKESADHRVTTDVVKLLWDVTKEQQIQNPTRVSHSLFHVDSTLCFCQENGLQTFKR